MAPTKPSKPSKPAHKGRKSSSTAMKSSSSSSTSSSFKSRSNSKTPRPPTKQQKTRPNLHNPTASQKSKLKKKPSYTDKQLAIPALNAITPANAAPSAPNNLNARGKRRKTFVDDEEGMRLILGVVQAQKEGDIESKMIRLRKLEEVRTARLAEAEKREGERKGRLEGVKEGMKREKKTKRRFGKTRGGGEEKENVGGTIDGGKKRKKVSFA